MPDGIGYPKGFIKKSTCLYANTFRIELLASIFHESGTSTFMYPCVLCCKGQRLSSFSRIKGSLRRGDGEKAAKVFDEL